MAHISIHNVTRIEIERGGSGVRSGWLTLYITDKTGERNEITLFLRDGKQPEIEGAEFLNLMQATETT